MDMLIVVLKYFFKLTYLACKELQFPITESTVELYDNETKTNLGKTGVIACADPEPLKALYGGPGHYWLMVRQAFCVLCACYV